jgi:hypothetical protein
MKNTKATGFIPEVDRGGVRRPGRAAEAETFLKKAPHSAEMAACTAKTGPWPDGQDFTTKLREY